IASATATDGSLISSGSRVMTMGWMRAIGVVSFLAFTASASAAADGDLERRLIDAIKSGNTAAVRAILDQHPNVNRAEADGTTALHHAVHREDVVLVKMLIRAGARVRAANRYGVEPLMLAAEHGNATIIQDLLKAGADVNAALPGGET